MDNQNEQDFTFGQDDGEEDYGSGVTNRQVAKLTQKVTLLSILIPCILVILVIFIYFDMNSKVGKVDSTGNAKVQTISNELEKTVTELQQKSDALEKRLNEKISKIDKTLAAINKKVKKAEKNISFLTYSKSNKKSTNSEIGKIKKADDEIRASIANLSSQNKDLIKIAEMLQKRTKELDSFNVSLKNLKTDLTSKTTGLVNKTDLDNSLKKQKRFFRLELDQQRSRLNKKITLLKYANQSEKKNTGVVEQDIKQ